MNQPAVAVLGFQTARGDARAELTRLNVELGQALDVPGLLRYQVLVRAGDERDDGTATHCVYWLWRDIADREAVWADPPAALSGFWTAARPLWRADPDVGRYRWHPAQERDLCPAGSGVALGPHVTGAPQQHLIDIDSGTTLSCRVTRDRPAQRWWAAVWQKSLNQERKA